MGIRSSKVSQPPSSQIPEQAVHGNRRSQLTKRQSQKFSHIGDQYNSLEQVTEALRAAGLESSNLIVGIDFTKSNEWTGKRSFNGRSLHSISNNERNPYEQAIYILGRTLSAFDDDNLIPCFGFGDATTHDQSVFSFYPDQQPCDGFEQALARYREMVSHIRLAGPTSFAPIIEAAIDIVEQSGGQYHVLLIIADGQVTRSVDTDSGQMSPQEQNTINAIVAASDYALSIVLVGVGDGPWDMMKQFDDNIPQRAFDNFQFVNFTEIMSRNLPTPQKEAAFALAALMEIPSQFKATMELNILNSRRGIMPNRAVFPPPRGVLQLDNEMLGYPHFTSFGRSKQFESVSAGSESSWNYGAARQPDKYGNSDTQVCPVCLTQTKNMAFGCGHQTCEDCAEDLVACPMCRQEITTKLRLY
eukprot:c13542_g1_i1 orf=493-1737(-)